eukprot:497171_1
MNPWMSYHNDKLYLGWVFLRNEIFNQMPVDVQNVCYSYIDERQLIIHIQRFELYGESLSDFFYALIKSCISMVRLHSIIYENNTYFANYNHYKNIHYPCDPKSVTYNLLCDTNGFRLEGVVMRYHKRFNNPRDPVITLFQRIRKFLQNPLTATHTNKKGLQNIILDIGKDHSLLVCNGSLHGSAQMPHDYYYDTNCNIALYQYQSVVWKNKCDLYDLLKGMIQIQATKWKRKHSMDVINHCELTQNLATKMIIFEIDTQNIQ